MTAQIVAVVVFGQVAVLHFVIVEPHFEQAVVALFEFSERQFVASVFAFEVVV